MVLSEFANHLFNIRTSESRLALARYDGKKRADRRIKKMAWSAAFERVSLPLAIAIVAVGAVFTYRDAVLYHNAQEKAVRAEKVVDDCSELLSALKDAETGQRGFLLTGRASYLQPYHASLGTIHEKVAQLTAEVSQPADVAHVQRIKGLVAAKLEELDDTIKLRQADKIPESIQMVLTGEGKRAMDDIRDECSQIGEAVREPMLAAQNAAENSAASLRGISIGSLLTLGVLLSLATLTIQRARHRREELIHELEQSRRAAAAARDVLDLTLRSIGDAVISTDHEGRIRFMNPVAQRLTGWREEDAIGQPLPHVFRIVNERTRDTVESPVEKVLRLGAVVGLANHTILLSKDGSEVAIDDSAAPIKTLDSAISGVVLVFRDITERRRAEKELEASRSALAQSNQALHRSNTDLEQFAYAVSHDLQEPLRAVASFSQLLGRNGTDSATAEPYLRNIQMGVSRMSDLIRDLLEYSRVNYDSETAFAPVSLDEVLGEVLWNLQTQIAATGAKIVSNPLPSVAADKRAMVQLLQNLLVNAIKYAGPKPPEIKVEAAPRSNGEWVIHVRDNGIGIDMRYAAKIFGVFKRLHTRAEYPGTGIGLAICKRIVELHGGTIWVESELAQGSTFSFTLPPPAHCEHEKSAAATA